MRRWLQRSDRNRLSTIQSHRLKFSTKRSRWGEITATIIALILGSILVFALFSQKQFYEISEGRLRNSLQVKMGDAAFKECKGDAVCINKKLPASFDDKAALDRAIQDEISDWNFGLLIVAVFGSATSVVGLIWIRASLAAAREANEINASAIANSERAWVFQEVERKSWIEYPDGIPQMEILVKNKNYGKTAAFNVRTHVVSSDIESIDTVMAQLTDHVLHVDHDDGLLIPPGEVRHRPWMWSGEDSLQVGIDPHKADFIVGCVAYETMFDDETHVSGFVYYIQWRTDGSFELSPWRGSFAT